jgi:hypothetical protein
MAGKALLLEARRRRALGQYTRETLSLYHRSWRLSRTPEAWLQLCLFRHELGYHLPPDWSCRLGNESGKLRTSDRQKADALCCQKQRALHATTQKRFCQWIRAEHREHVAVVGNGAGLLGKKQSRSIESADCIIRFNHWQAPAVDVGRRTDVWVRSPIDMRDSRSPAPYPPPSWVAVSGPEMICRHPDWQAWALENVSTLLAVPLNVWRSLVRELMAPPSAGVLTLGWLRSIRGHWHGITAYGIGYSGGQYHAAKARHRPSHRHHWARELTILERWSAEGLQLVRA